MIYVTSRPTANVGFCFTYVILIFIAVCFSDVVVRAHGYSSRPRLFLKERRGSRRGYYSRFNNEKGATNIPVVSFPSLCSRGGNDDVINDMERATSASTIPIEQYHKTNDYKNTNYTLWEKWQIGQGVVPVEPTSINDWIKGTFYEEYWECKVPSLLFQEQQLDANNDTIRTTTNGSNQYHLTKIKIDGHSFYGRMAIYKYLIQDWENSISSSLSSNPNCNYNQSNDVILLSLMKQLWGSNNINEKHWLWSYGAQLDWQYRSLRLNSFKVVDNENSIYSEDEFSITTTSSNAISSSSWWGYMNFCFSVAILLGAVNASNNLYHENNIMKKIIVDMDPESQKLIDSDIACQECVRIWQQLFENVYPLYCKKIQHLNDAHTLKSTNEKLHQKELTKLRFQFQQEVWKTHTSIIEAAAHSIRSNELLQLLPYPERLFGLGWVRMVHILAATTFPTDLITLVQDGTGFLPFSVITDTVLDEWRELKHNNLKNQSIYDQNDPVALYVQQCHYRAIQTTHQLVQIPDRIFYHVLVPFWKRIVRQRPNISRTFPQRINKLVHGTNYKVKMMEFGKLIVLFLRPW